MFQKVLVVEDIDSIALSVVQLVESLGAHEVVVVKYCEDAWTKLKAEALQGRPFELLITDLSFEKDHRQDAITGGEALVAQVKAFDPQLAVVVYSIEDKPFRIQQLYHEHGIGGYVLKGRRSLEQLKTALLTVAAGERYYAPELQTTMRASSFVSLDGYELHLLEQLAAGYSLDEMEARFKVLGITPHSKSTIEKRLYRLRDSFNARTLMHLISLAKDQGVI
ncbi:DNA-binding response regulator, NarL/FixJ family, contains REC and HTH domains [Flavobacterium fontis]|uniref:DNA-binding response regulator, NarL/FixJ family, contains REC and HTH domains n=1 Tax=Flavobacterium fontis TaxID=1124188 RepID=A0A1M5CDZ1_9FLAO|nr:response regulator transcription factor [Flavobacterium fontis]SHF52958.1 DNA-binding response regulator, NarL/FixJ family, contains REC and HTH domains [Flavobacterium fontis]